MGGAGVAREVAARLRAGGVGAFEEVDAIRRTVAERPFEPGRGAEPLWLSFSAGLVTFPQEGGDLSRLLRRADQRLQRAKQSGRNRVVARDL